MLVFSETIMVTYIFFIFTMRAVSSITEEKRQRSMATFLANEINSTEGNITGPTAHVQTMFPSNDKKCMVFEGIFSGT